MCSLKSKFWFALEPSNIVEKTSIIRNLISGTNNNLKFAIKIWLRYILNLKEQKIMENLQNPQLCGSFASLPPNQNKKKTWNHALQILQINVNTRSGAKPQFEFTSTLFTSRESGESEKELRTTASSHLSHSLTLYSVSPKSIKPCVSLFGFIGLKSKALCGNRLRKLGFFRDSRCSSNKVRWMIPLKIGASCYGTTPAREREGWVLALSHLPACTHPIFRTPKPQPETHIHQILTTPNRQK